MLPSRTRQLLVGLATAALVLALPISANAATLYATAGPGYTISLRTAGGAKVTTVRAGVAYSIVVRDRSRIHNFQLTGPGVRRSTTVAEVATRTWRVVFRPGRYGFVCSPHSLAMMGTFRARA